MKLTKTQVRHLRSLCDGERSAYPGLLLGTLNSLALKGLAKADRQRLGAIAMPQTRILWTITEAGREALAANNK